jgi:hypothetical protein
LKDCPQNGETSSTHVKLPTVFVSAAQPLAPESGFSQPVTIASHLPFAQKSGGVQSVFAPHCDPALQLGEQKGGAHFPSVQMNE